MADVSTPRVGRSQSSSRGVTVAASQRQKPKNAPFKFLRKDEGRLSYTCQLESPLATNNANHSNSIRDAPSSERRGSRSLREAIANDMRKGKNHDPFEAVVIAVPKRAPPPNSSLRDNSQPPPDIAQTMERRPNQPQQQQQQQAQQQQQQQPPPQQQQQRQPAPKQQQPKQKPQHVTRRPEWVDPEIPETNGDAAIGSPAKQQQYMQQSRISEDSDRTLELAIPPRFNTGHSHSTPRREGEYDDMEWQQSQQRRWRNDDMVDNGILRRATPRRYADPVDVENEYSRGSRNLFRRPQRQEYLISREQDLVEQLEDELRAAKEERGRYHQLTTHLERERQRFEDYCSGVERGFEVERAELDAARASGQWQAKKDVKVIEERYKSTLELLRTERESNKKLTTENEFLRQQLEGITTRMREARKLQKAETSRLRREIESLARRNEELLELAREQQIVALESGARVPPAAAIGTGSRPQRQGSGTSTQRSSDGPYYVVDDLQSEDGELDDDDDEEQQLQQQRTTDVEERERRRIELEERRRLETEEKERKRLEIEERRRHEAEERDRKRHEFEERKRREAEERERKRLEIEERKRQEAEEKERKRLEIEERRRHEAEERERKRLELEERKRLEIEERKRQEAEEKERKRLELEERKRQEAEEKERKRLELEERKRKEREESVRRQNEEQERKQQQQQQQQQQQTQPQQEQQNSRSVSVEEVENKTQEPRVQRRAAGHPVHTPRAQYSKAASNEVQQRASPRTVSPSVSRRPRRTPTVAELIADDEPVPTEDFPNDVVVSQAALGENPNKREVLYRSGKREIHYANGTRKVILPSGHVVLYFTNGDVKRTFPSGKSMYWYAAAQTTHVQHADGVQVFQFHASGQIERHLPDGKKEILYPDGIYKVIFADGRDETIFPEEL